MNLTITHLFYVTVCILASFGLVALVIIITQNVISNNLIKLNTQEINKSINKLQLSKEKYDNNHKILYHNSSLRNHKKNRKKIENYKPTIYPKSAIRNTTNINDLF
tara:strand:- start:822 stop:1139 length:318 start_codon:yes stop_codon:yes gene_type:complete